MGCGVYYPALKGHCGRCKGQIGTTTGTYVYFILFDLLIPIKNVLADHRPNMGLITKCANEHAAMASQYQLNQKNGLSKAQDIKAKENALKQQHKAEMVTIEG